MYFRKLVEKCISQDYEEKSLFTSSNQTPRKEKNKNELLVYNWMVIISCLQATSLILINIFEICTQVAIRFHLYRINYFNHYFWIENGTN